MTRPHMALVAPEPKPRKPVYPRVPLFGGVTDRREAWQARRDADESERLRALCIAQSKAAGVAMARGRGA